ncbi:MAG: aspartyl-phosphate phosphatase Spo0E family protein [Alicyclobacillus sp.]|nr:aspartyl-phosphate phosphatase Spo0E family protein [Alicyclobacillus sp.]
MTQRVELTPDVRLIEQLRWQLIQAAENRQSLTHPDVVALSQRLDRLITRYQHHCASLGVQYTQREEQE